MSLDGSIMELHLEILGHLDLGHLLEPASTIKHLHSLMRGPLLHKSLAAHEVVLLNHLETTTT